MLLPTLSPVHSLIMTLKLGSQGAANENFHEQFETVLHALSVT